MKKTTLFSLLTLLFLLVGSNVRADELFYTLETVPFATGSNHTNYNDYFDDEHDGMTWNAPGNQSLDGCWRIGGKSLTNVDRTITAKTPMGSAIGRVVVNHKGTSRSQVTVNSMKLTVASDVNYTSIIDEVELTPSIALQTAGEVEFVSSTGAEWATGAYYKLTINLSNTSSSNGGLDLTSIEFYAPDGGGSTVTVAKPVITPAGGTYNDGEAVEVSITAEEGCTIYYTTDGTAPSDASTRYTGPFTVETDSWVKAIAYDVTGASSNVAEAVFQFATAVPSIGRLCALTPASGNREVLVEFNDWIVTGVKSKNAYFTDGRNGILLYQDGHNFEVGDKLTGTATFNLTTYNGAPEITGLTSTTTGVSVEKNATATPQVISITDLATDMQGCLITLKGVTYDGTYFVDADDNKITPYDSFSAGYTLENGQTYDATGVAIWFKPKSGDGYWEIAPRTAGEFAEASAAVAKPVITPAGGTFAEAQTVTITADEGCTIIYTTDGTEPDATAGNQYTGPFTVSEDCIVKAVAIDADDNFSAVATAEFKFITTTAIPSIGRLCPLATEEEQSVLVQFNDWVVTGVNGNQVYFSDGMNGVVGYQKEHGFELGDKLTGTAVVNLVLYNECAEVTGLTKDTEGVTVTKGATLDPMTVAIADLEKDLQGCLVRYEGLTFANGVFVDDDDNTITPYNAFKLTDYPTLLEGKTYNVTGVAIWFSKNGVWEIAPRTADEFELVTSQIAPESSWSVEEEVVDINGESTAVFTTNSDGAVTYTSSNEAVATIDEEGNITLVGRGTTVITADVAETNTYLADSKSFTLTVTKDGYTDATFAYTDEDILGQGISGGGAGFSATRADVLTLSFTNAFGHAQHIKVYGNGADIEKSNVELSVTEGYAITKVVFNLTGDKAYRSIWIDQFGEEAPYENEDSLTVTWTGVQNKVILNNLYNSISLNPKQARIRTIDVTFIKLEDTGKTVTIGESGYATFCGEAGAILSRDGEWALAGAVTSFGGNDGTVLTVDTLTASIPAGQGVVLMGTPGEYKVYTHPEFEGRSIEFNMLTGVLSDTEVSPSNYVFREENGIGGFFLVEDAPVTVPGGQAYLSVPGTNGIYAFFFTEEDYVTGIAGVATESVENATVYNLAGQRLGKMQKGVNIVGGKKILK